MASNEVAVKTDHHLLWLAGLLALGYLLFSLRSGEILATNIPVVGVEPGDWFYTKTKKRFAKDGVAILRSGLASDAPFQVVSDKGAKIVLPPRYTNEVRSHPDLDIDEANNAQFFVNWPAFNSFKPFTRLHIMQDMIKKNLTGSLTLITEPVNEECTIAIEKLWPETTEWQPTFFLQQALLFVSQVSSRVFLGAPLCRDQRLIEIMRDYTTILTPAAQRLREWPTILRPFVFPFIPEIRTLSNIVRMAHELMDPEVEKRRARRKAAQAEGKSYEKKLDSIEWLEEVANGRNYDVVGSQLCLSFAAIHTTSMSLARCIYELIPCPELMEELRLEITQTLADDGGWQKTTLTKLHLMDAVMKEAQRLSPVGAAPFRRVAKRRIVLQDGTIIPKGAEINIPTLHMQDDKWYSNAERFDGKRFLELRKQQGMENRYHFVSTSPEHMGFGHGHKACPGRFFASNEIKLCLAHLLMKFDWKFADGKMPEDFMVGTDKGGDLSARLLYKSRKCEVDFK